MSAQDLTVLVNLAERCRKTGNINFDEFTIVGDAVKRAVAEIERLSTKTEPSTPAKREAKKES